jgi:universal stress protein A
MSQYRQIIAAIDFQDSAELVAQRAQGIARLNDSRLTLLHVVEPIPVDAASEALLTPSTSIEAELYQNARERMRALSDLLGLEADQQRVTVGHTKREIFHLAEELGADLIVVGSHGRHGLSLLLGSPATAVLHGAPCDVLAIRLRTGDQK